MEEDDDIYIYCIHMYIIYVYMYAEVGRDISLVIATRYGLECPAIESRWRAKFSPPVQTGPGAHLASCTIVTWSLSRG
jgi:hypothetical protein